MAKFYLSCCPYTFIRFDISFNTEIINFKIMAGCSKLKQFRAITQANFFEK